MPYITIRLGKFTLVLLSTVWLFSACSTQSKMMRQANVQSNAGMHEEAANLYYNVLLSDPKNKDAKTGLLQNAQTVLADKFAKFSKQVIDDRIEDALKTYQYAQGYTRNAAKVGVALKWPTEYDEVYQDILKEYTEKQFDLGVDLMQNRKYETAEKVFERIASFDSAYKNVSVLRLHTVLDPVYVKATQTYQKGNYKEAYFLYNKIAAIDDGYKDVVKMRGLALQQATAVVGVLPMQVHSSNASAMADLPDMVADILSQQQGAYVKIANVKALKVDLTNRGFTAIQSTNQAIEAAQSLNLGYAVVIWVDTFLYQKQKPEMYTRDAYEAVTERVLNPYTNTYSSISKFKKATYTDKTEGQQLTVKLRYQVLQVKTGQVLHSQTLSVVKTDELHAATFKGNPANLYPTLPEGNFLPQVTPEWRNMFTGTNKNLVPLTEFNEMVLTELADKMAHQIQQKIQ